MVCPTLLNLSLKFAIRSSWSEPQSAPGLIFWWLYRAFPSSSAKNIYNQCDFSIAHLVIPCVESFFVLLEMSVCFDQSIFFNKTLLAFALLHFVLQGQSCLQLWVSLDFLHFCIPIPYDENGIFCDVSSKKCYRSSQNFPTSACFSGITSWGIDLDYCDVEWFALEMNWDYTVIFEALHPSTAF